MYGHAEGVLDEHHSASTLPRRADAVGYGGCSPDVVALHGHLWRQSRWVDLDAASDDVIVTTEEVLDAIQPLTQARTTLWVDGGLDGLEAAELAFQTVHDDLLHHGELRGVEIKLTDMLVEEIDATTVQVTAELGVSDGEAMLAYDISFSLTV